MSDEQEQTEVWPFAPSYEPSYSSLPPSQLRECIKRLSSRARNPLSAEALTQENPEVEGVLGAVKKAYLAKKDRAKVASAAKRATQRELKPDNVAVEVEAIDDITAQVAELSLEPAEVVAALAQPEPEPEPEPVKPAPSKPIPVPSRIPVVRQQPAAAAAAPRNQPKKVGLAAKFAVGEPPHPR